MGLIVRVPLGLRRVRTVVFSEDQARIVFGRDPDRSHILFAPNVRAVGLEHCALERVLGRYRLLLNADDEVFVNGKPALEGEELPRRCRLRLGRHGPRIKLQRTDRQDLPITVRPRSAGLRLPRMRALLAAVRLNRVAVALALVLTFLGLGGSLQAWRKAKEPGADRRLESVLRDAIPSVWRVVGHQPGGEDRAVGTAWIVARDTLATNAHVADAFRHLRGSEQLVVRSPGARPRTVRVVDITVHPGYHVFRNEISPQGRFAGACDVALLHVAPGSALGRPLRVASDRQLHALTPGMPVGSVGYPSENLIFGGSPVDRPVPTLQVGRITATTDFWGRSQKPALNLLLQNSLPGTGGDSGSPVLSADGAVLGLINAGNFARGLNGRIPVAAGINFAQRVDLLQELIDGSAREEQDRRSAAWRNR